MEGQGPVNFYSTSLPGYARMLEQAASGKPFNPFKLEPYNRNLDRYLLLLRLQR